MKKWYDTGRWALPIAVSCFVSRRPSMFAVESIKSVEWSRLCPIVYQLIFASVPPAICLPISRGLFVVVVCLLPFVDSMLVHETSAAVERKTWRLESIRCSTAHRVSSSKSYSAVTINGRTDDQIHDDSIWSGVEDFLSSTSYLSHSQSTDGLKKHFEKGAVDRPLE